MLARRRSMMSRTFSVSGLGTPKSPVLRCQRPKWGSSSFRATRANPQLTSLAAMPVQSRQCTKCGGGLK
eukprot:5400566-Amphidinium_carterae.1